MAILTITIEEQDINTTIVGDMRLLICCQNGINVVITQQAMVEIVKDYNALSNMVIESDRKIESSATDKFRQDLVRTIDDYTVKLNKLKQIRIDCFDDLTDEERQSYEYDIQQCAKFVTDTKSLLEQHDKRYESSTLQETTV